MGAVALYMDACFESCLELLLTSCMFTAFGGPSHRARKGATAIKLHWVSFRLHFGGPSHRARKRATAMGERRGTRRRRLQTVSAGGLAPANDRCLKHVLNKLQSIQV